MTGQGIRCQPVTGIGEVAPGDDLAAMVSAHIELSDGDVVVVTSKVVSKAEGRVVDADRSAAIADETDRTVAVRGDTSIVRTRHGLVMAAAGVDASNTRPGSVVLLPVDPDGSARRLREALATQVGRNVAVVVTDTSGRAWRSGQTDIAIGAAGIEPMQDLAGTIDDHGNLLTVTAPAVADEIAAAADLVSGKIAGIPVTVVRGLAELVLPAGQHGPGATALIRPEEQDMFGYGARDAVVAALSGSAEAVRGFGAAASARELCRAFEALRADEELTGFAVAIGDGGSVDVHLEAPDQRTAGRLEARLVAVGLAMGWLAQRPEISEIGVSLRFRRATP